MSEKATSTVLIIEDHPIYRMSLSELITSTSPRFQVKENPTGDGLLESLQTLKPAIIILDIKLPGRSGWDLLSDLDQCTSWAGKVILLTSFSHPLILALARRHEVSALVSKEDQPACVLEAIESVENGSAFYGSPAFLAMADTGMETPSIQEMRVLKAIAAGSTGKEIAAGLGLSEKTIETYRTRLMKKTNCKNAADLTRLALESGLS